MKDGDIVKVIIKNKKDKSYEFVGFIRAGGKAFTGINIYGETYMPLLESLPENWITKL